MRNLQTPTIFWLVLVRLGGAASNSCADLVPSGDKRFGISAIEDERCMDGGTGCFPENEVCRFCQTSKTLHSRHFFACADLQDPKFDVDQSVGSFVEEAGLDCAGFVSSGDQGVGISAVPGTSPACVANGLGCFRSGQCRYCQTRSTRQSGHLLKCENVGGSTPTSTPAPTPALTTAPAPTTAPEPAPTLATTSCTTVVAQSGFSGVSYVIEGDCNAAAPTKLGCAALTSCQLCRNEKNEANQFLMSCAVLEDEQALDDSITVQTSSTAAVRGVSVDAVSNLSMILVGCVGAMAVMVAIVGIVHAKHSRLDPDLELCATPDDAASCENGTLAPAASQSQLGTF